MLQWYYVDKNQQRVGPMAASVLIEALRYGQLNLNTMIWQEGMQAWQPLSMHLDALGVPEAMRVRKQAKTSSVAIWIIAIVVVGFFGIAVLGILAAIAVPAYSDYTVRAKVTEGLNMAAAAKLAVAETRQNTGKWPNNDAEAGYTMASSNIVSEITIPSAQEVRITYSSAVREISGETLMLRAEIDANGNIEWACNAAGSQKLGGSSGTLLPKYAPANCRP
jgi:type IV pilus assembly protein PilA